MLTLKLVAAVSLFISAIYEINAANLPSYFTACSRSHPNLNKCTLEEGIKGFSSFIKGDSSVNVPSLTPLKLDEVNLEVGPNLKFKFTDCILYGIEDAVLKTADIDLKENKLKIELLTSIRLMAQYKVDGRILILPIVGEGPVNISLTEGHFIFKSDLEYYDKKNVKYLKIVNEDLTYTMKKMILHFENLFNGDPRLGPELNHFFADSWKEVADELYPSLKETIQQVVTSIASRFLAKVPFDKLFEE